jgi:galactose mutarotase-like enzyme
MGRESHWVSISSGDLTAEIDPQGAQLSRLRDRAGRDLLWDGDPAVWNGRAPLLFPIVGALAGGAYRLGAKVYRLPRHGFARNRLFELVRVSAADAMFRLKADAASQEVYPFQFELDIRYSLYSSTLTVSALIHNRGDADMPASFGYHPAFRWPLPFGRSRSSHFVEFAEDEPAPVRRLDADGLLAPARHASPIAGRRLALDDNLFVNDALILDAIRSRSVLFGADDGPCLRVGFANAPYFGIWSKPQAPFVCLEPWHGIADVAGFSGDFTAKTGIFMVAPGTPVPIEMQISLL